MSSQSEALQRNDIAQVKSSQYHEEDDEAEKT